MNIIEKGIEKRVTKIKGNKPMTKIHLSDEMTEIFEKWRRGE